MSGNSNSSDAKPSEPRKIQQLIERSNHPAQWVFAAALTLLSFWLLLNLTSQAKFPSSKAFVSQPGFWPAISLAGMGFFSCYFLISSWRESKREKRAGVTRELTAWVQVIEFPLWFLAYVWVVPIVGYLPTTVLFSLVMTLRLGYRKKAIYWAAVLVSISVVLVFKSFLEVKIPGGELYQYLPDSIRNFVVLKL